MEPLTLATTALIFLLPYLQKAGESAAQEVGKKFPGTVGQLWQAIITRFGGKSAAEEAAEDLLAHPEDQDVRGAFRGQLRKALEADPDFATELERLLNAAQRESGDTILNTGSGAVGSRGGVAAGEGGVAIKGDVHGNITTGRPEKP